MANAPEEALPHTAGEAVELQLLNVEIVPNKPLFAQILPFTMPAGPLPAMFETPGLPAWLPVHTNVVGVVIVQMPLHNGQDAPLKFAKM